MIAVIGIFGINLSACGIADINRDSCVIRFLASNEGQILLYIILGWHCHQGKVHG